MSQFTGRGPRGLPVLGSLIALVAAAGAAYALIVRPWHIRWGATRAEASHDMPGDDLIPQPRLQSTRAVTIGAPAGDVWPWLVQIGFQRAGWYSYDLLERAIGVGDFVDGHSATRIIPELQQLHPGDVIRTDPDGGFTVAAIEPERVLALRARINACGRHSDPAAPLEGSMFDTSWVFTLRRLAPDVTRLSVRFRAGYLPTVRNELFARALLEPIVFIMERKMLLGICRRAEAMQQG